MPIMNPSSKSPSVNLMCWQYSLKPSPIEGLINWAPRFIHELCINFDSLYLRKKLITHAWYRVSLSSQKANRVEAEGEKGRGGMRVWMNFNSTFDANGNFSWISWNIQDSASCLFVVIRHSEFLIALRKILYIFSLFLSFTSLIKSTEFAAAPSNKPTKAQRCEEEIPRNLSHHAVGRR